MNDKEINISDKNVPLSVEEIELKTRTEFEKIICFCTQNHEGMTLFKFEKELRKLLSYLGCLFIQLFLMSYHEKLNYSKWLNTGLYYVRKVPVAKTIKTVGNVLNLDITFFIAYISIPNSYLLINIPMRISCIFSDFEKHIVFLARRLILVRNVRCFLSIFWVFFLLISWLAESR